MAELTPPTPPPAPTGSPERLKAYTDAVVAIAQTLLILPLLEGVSDARAHHLGAAAWLRDSGDLLLWFSVSFVLIGSFWLTHHRVFEHIEHISEPLQALNFIWLFAIVFMPVATALLSLDGTQPTQVWLYVGSLLLSGVAMNGIVLLLVSDRRLRGRNPALRAGNVAASFSMTVMLLLALALNLLGLGFRAMFIMFLMPVAVRVLTPAVRRLGWAR